MTEDDIINETFDEEIKVSEKHLNILVDVEFGSTSHKCGATMSVDTIKKTNADYIKEMLHQIEYELKKVIPKMLEIEGGKQNE